MATKLVIEPIFEANFLDCSHGFRPERSAPDAIQKIERTNTFKGQRVVFDADIMGFYNNIRQDILLSLVQRRIADARVVRLIRMWLEAGVMEDGKYIETNGLGTPQGGVIFTSLMYSKSCLSTPGAPLLAFTRLQASLTTSSR